MTLEVLVDGSLNKVTLPKLGNLELPLQLCRNPEVPLFGQYALFFKAYCPSRAPRGRRPHLCVLVIRCSFVCLGPGCGVRQVVNGIVGDWFWLHISK